MDDSMHQYTIKDLAEFMQAAREDKDQKPFIFITGAGCSVKAGIPLAEKIVSELNEQFALELKPLSDEDRRDYGKCMGRLETSKRRRYLQEYIGKAKINWSHIALACLIKEGYVRRVLTFNFDNLLARSCGLLGQYPPTYDFTAANLNLHRLIDDPAIVHLHGQGHGFVQLNTDSETEAHATRLKEFVGHTLSESPTLFIGYSGENDAFLPQVEEQFSDQHRLFWVDMGDQAPEHLQQKLLTSSLAHYMSCENGADLFLIQLAQKLGCFPPTIFADPYQHLLNELDEIADYPMPKEDLSEDKKENRSIRSNTSTQDILLGTKNKLKEVQQQDKEGETDFLQEYLQNDYEKIIRKLEDKKSLNFQQSLWLARAYFGSALQETSAEKQVSIYEKLISRFEENTELNIREQVAKALVNKALVLEGIDQLHNAIEVYDEAIAKFGESNELGLQEFMAIALVNKGVALGNLKQSENAIKAYNEAIEKFGERNEISLQEPLTIAINNIGYSKLMVAKKQWQNTSVAREYLHQALKDFSKALIKSSRDHHATILGNVAYTEFLQGNMVDSESHLREALQQGRQPFYDETIKDLAKDPIDLDNDFKDLLEKVWNEINE
ncbi:SIR2 family protein [Psychrobacter fjordensis]|uniref:SIR2 family protein n=1 Tax=Psychrobacter fjordensis TaxID=664424 RepID=UPI001919287E|nr:SIR2 family protein [Psychrobacter fjordensis]